MTVIQIDVDLPDELAAAVERGGIPASTICQRALEQAVRRANALRADDLRAMDEAALTARLPHYTARARAALRLALDQAGPGGAVTSAGLLGGILAEGSNLAVRLLPALGVDPAALAADLAAAPAGEDDTPAALAAEGDAPRFSGPAVAALELAASEAMDLHHNYIGCEHLLLGLLHPVWPDAASRVSAQTGHAGPDGAAGRALRARGAGLPAARAAVVAAVAGLAHARAANG
ncbi:Clp protease N-terminal domain-containing protein [Dactylosporangium sp. CA-233914]|uniref:Clp protease N-terminal domain-containing protein n=1 Tax=Dactylosporangium sp. CA-233914 TaxID=3239934 RepID=UPI003D8F8DB3